MTLPDRLSQQEFREQFPALRSRVWFDSPGSPPGALPVLDAMTSTMNDWRDGDFSWRDWDWAAEDARDAFAGYAGVAPRTVAIMGSVAEAAATVAQALPAGSIVVPDEDFRSTLFPWLALDPRRNPVVRVRSADGMLRTEDLIAAIRPDTVLCALSDTLTSNGVHPDFAAIRAATDAVGARMFVDLTQSFSILAFDFETVRPDFVAVHGYKWMLCPRGSAWLVVREDRIPELSPLLPSWKSTAPPFGYFGGELELPDDASRLDTSPAWFSWIGAIAAIDLLGRLDRAEVERHVLRLSNLWWREAVSLGYAPLGDGEQSHISIVDIGRRPAAALLSRFEERGIRAQLSGTRLRIGVHYFNTERDVEVLLEAMAVD